MNDEKVTPQRTCHRPISTVRGLWPVKGATCGKLPISGEDMLQGWVVGASMPVAAAAPPLTLGDHVASRVSFLCRLFFSGGGAVVVRPTRRVLVVVVQRPLVVRVRLACCPAAPPPPPRAGVAGPSSRSHRAPPPILSLSPVRLSQSSVTVSVSWNDKPGSRACCVQDETHTRWFKVVHPPWSYQVPSRISMVRSHSCNTGLLPSGSPNRTWDSIPSSCPQYDMVDERCGRAAWAFDAIFRSAWMARHHGVFLVSSKKAGAGKKSHPS